MAIANSAPPPPLPPAATHGTHLYATSRIAAQPCSNDGKRKPRYSFNSGSGLILNTASETKPNEPSLPIIISLMLGPVEVRGTLQGLVMTPVGVTMVADTSRSSMLPYMGTASEVRCGQQQQRARRTHMFFFMPEARVAIHPPTVLNSILRTGFKHLI